MTNTKIIGLGNAYGGDDAVGVLVARQLHAYSSSEVGVVEGGLAGLNLLHEMEKIDTLILIDAIHSHSQPGTILHFTLPQDLETIKTLAWKSSTSSTHSLGLAEALTLAHTLDVLPGHTTLYGIELGHLQQGDVLSPSVTKAMTSVVDQILHNNLNPSHA